MNIYDYFSSLQRSIAHNQLGFLDEPVAAKAITEQFGQFRARVIFWDGSHLTINESIDTSQGYPEIIRYAYTYVRQDQHVFRYDNAPHYPELTTFPHHIHVGPDETPQAADQPSLSQVFSQIEETLGQQSI